MKYSGMIGFLDGTEETKTDIYEDRIVEKIYQGDFKRNHRSLQNSQDVQLTGEFTVNNQISIISDMYLRKHWSFIKYVVIDGVAWLVKTIHVGYPRCILEIGGLYNGKRPNGTESDSS